MSVLQQAPDDSDLGAEPGDVRRLEPVAPATRPVRPVVEGAVFWLVLALVLAAVNGPTREWLRENLGWSSLALAAVLLAGILVLRWVGSASTQARSAVLLVFGYPLGTLVVASAFVVFPAQWQLVAVRGVVLLVLVLTPAVMWWLFLASQRASLLNEFLANLQRLGLLDAHDTGRHAESAQARRTRISSYLQRFEASYGRLPEKIHAEVLANAFQPYSRKDTRTRTAVAITAVPVALAGVLLAVGWMLALPPLDDFPVSATRPRWLLALTPNLTPVTAAFLGAYFFSLQMLFRRYVRSDLRGSAYMAVVIRIVLAVVGIWVIQQIGAVGGWSGQPELLMLGFVVGVFPTVVWQVLRSAAMKTFCIALPSLASRLPLERLDGLTVWHEARLEEEDVENVGAMATVDVVDLLVNTRFPVERIVDWIDQSILLVHLGPDEADDGRADGARRKLALHGVRTATSLLRTERAHQCAGTAEQFAAVLTDADGRPALPSLVAAVRSSGNLPLVLRWRGVEP
jgi:hypothetical protein